MGPTRVGRACRGSMPATGMEEGQEGAGDGRERDGGGQERGGVEGVEASRHTSRAPLGPPPMKEAPLSGGP